MKKLLSVVFVCLLAAVIVGCGSSSSPRGIAEKGIKCIMKGDVEGYADLVYLKESEKSQKPFLIQMISEMMKNIKPDQEIESYEFVEEDVDKEAGKAKVTFNMKYKSGRTSKEPVYLVLEDGKWWMKLGR